MQPSKAPMAKVPPLYANNRAHTILATPVPAIIILRATGTLARCENTS